jgi:C-8 sterol isomerase
MGFLFDPDVIDEIGQRHIGKPMDALVTGIGADLKAKYGEAIHLDQPFFFNSAGGILYQIKLFAMTPREYVMVCGSAIGASGHSGRHPVAFWDTILSGGARYMHEGELEARDYPTGARIFVDRWQSAAIDFPDHCWMLEYARGALFALLPFGMANTLFNTLDGKSALRTLRVYATLTRRNFARRRATKGTSP